MSNGEVIDAAERFIARGNRPEERVRGIGGTIIYLSTPKNQEKMIATSAYLATSKITCMLDAKGYHNEATLIIERAEQFLSEGIPVDEIREMAGQYLQNIDPRLYEAYEASNH